MSRIRTVWALGLGLLLLAGCGVEDAVAGAAKQRSRRECVQLRLGDCDVAATTHTWISQTGIYSSAASWDTAQIPGVGGAGLDTALLDGTSNVSVIGETPGGNALSRLVTTPKYKGHVGAPGNPLIVDVSSHLVFGNMAIFRGRGNVWFKGVVGNHTDVVIDTDTFDSVVSLDGPLLNIHVKSGKYEILPAGFFGSLTVLSDRAQGVVRYAGDLNANYWILGGTLEMLANNQQELVVLGGHVIHRGLLKDAANLTLRGGWFEYAPTASISGHNPELYLLGGTFDVLGLKETLSPATLVIGPDATILGNAIGSGVPSGTARSIDLRPDYPIAP